jgi:hypothetical protein
VAGEVEEGVEQSLVKAPEDSWDPKGQFLQNKEVQLVLREELAWETRQVHW